MDTSSRGTISIDVSKACTIILLLIYRAILY